MSRYKLIVFDMDGTLLNSAKQIDPATLEAIRDAAAAGKYCALGTGRCLPELRSYFPQIPDVRYAITTSGSGIFDCRAGAYLSCSPIPQAAVEQLLQLSAGWDVMTHFLLPDGSVCAEDKITRMGEYSMGVYQQMFEKLALPVTDMTAFYTEKHPEILKLNFYCRSPEQRDALREHVSGIPISIAYAETASLECSPLGINKGSGLAALCSCLGISVEDAIAVGDSGNDLDMLRAAGLGIAMANATPEAKAAADVQVADCDHAGCAEAIRRYLL